MQNGSLWEKIKARRSVRMVVSVVVVLAAVSGAFAFFTSQPAFQWLLDVLTSPTLTKAIGLLAMLSGPSILGMMIFGWWEERRKSRFKPVGVDEKYYDSEPLIAGALEFYSARAVLEHHSSIRTKLDSADEHWVLWNTGSNALQREVMKSRKISRVLLPRPGGGTVSGP